MPYVYSTTTSDGAYVEYRPDLSARGPSEVVRKVVIKGGHGVATKHLVTPKGIVTQVTEDELEFLLKNDAFQRHMKAGFMTYENVKKMKTEAADKAADMADADGSAPLTPADFKESENGMEDSKIYKGRPKK